MKNANIFIALMTLMISFSACKKDETGIPGSAGPQGATGLAGPGNSSIQTHIIQLTSANWTGSSSNHIWSASVTDSTITQAIVDSGMVNIYYFLPSTSSWTPLAYTQVITINSYIFRITDYTYEANKINFKVSQNYGGPVPANPGSTKFKVVVTTAFQRRANPFLDWDNYEEVKEALDLKG